jgi:hypothetical protein
MRFYTHWLIPFFMYVEDSRNPFRLGKKSYKDSWMAIARQLLETVELPAYSVRGCPPSSSTPLRLQTKDWAHFPAHNLKKNLPKGVVCFQQGEGCETTWQCNKCGVPLHILECFKLYHISHYSKTCLVSTYFQCSTVKLLN